MNITAVTANPDKSSLSHQVYHEITAVLKMASHKIYQQDLYADQYNPVLSYEEVKRRFSLDPKVSRYAKELTDSQGIIVVHPDWWGGPPAILKGWVDRVFSPGIAYDVDRAFPGDPGEKQELLKDKKAIVLCLSDNRTDNEILRLFWEEKVFGWCGLSSFRMLHLDDLANRSFSDVADWKRLAIRETVTFLTGALEKPFIS